jgi:hypothetical protein
MTETSTHWLMVCPDSNPLRVPDDAVRRVHMFDIPTTLRSHAYALLDMLPGGRWWTVGEFQPRPDVYAKTAVARRVLHGDRLAVEFGIESGD